MVSAAPRNDQNVLDANLKEQFSSYTTWGYWQIAYEEPGAGTDKFAAPTSYWIAGEKTSAAQMQGLLVGASYSSSYVGGAQGTRIDNYNSALPKYYAMKNGQTNINVTFTAGQPSLTGTMQFPGKDTVYDAVKINLSGAGAQGSSDFTLNAASGNYYAGATATGNTSTPAIPSNVSINGSFYGAAEASLGGNFDMQLPAVNNTGNGGHDNQAARIFGVYGADKQ